MYSHTDPTRLSQRRRGPFIAGDPRAAIAGFVMIGVSAFVVPSTLGLSLVLLYVLALHRLAGLPRRSLAGAARIVGPFILLVVAVNAVLVGGEPLVSALPFVSRQGVLSGLHGGVRVSVLYMATSVFLGVVSAEDVAKGVSHLVRPASPALARRAAMYGFLSFGFLPLFVDEVRRIATAQKFRGADLERGFAGKLSGARLLVVPLVVSAVRRSEQLAAAVELRRIRERIAGILVLEGASGKDYLFIAVTLCVVAAAWIAF